MKEHDLAIPFDVNAIHENPLKKLIRKTNILIKAGILRTFEILISAVGVISLLPLSIVIYFQNLKHNDNGPIFYTQDRIGKDGKVFKMFKFRTMSKNADEVLQAMLSDEEIKKEYETYRKFKHDPRLTTFGKILREKSLDEFPQFINVLLGQMSIVGPRPYMPEEKEKMGDYFDRIVSHKPGMTGVFQISGRERVTFDERLDMDIKYHYRKSFKMDLKIALITLLVTFVRKETYNLGEITADTAGYISRLIYAGIKRVIDIVGGIVGCLFLLPLSIIIFIGNRLCGDTGPLFYSQDRIGKNGKIFKMYKFRSMVVGAEEKLKHDPRVTKIGNLIRKTSLDEFPQFINVLKGDLSIVGPRAYMVTEKKDMGDAYENIVKCKPGVTGLWQVSGRSDVTFDDRLDMDLRYYEKYNLGMDLNILFKTFSAVLTRNGAE